MPEPGCAYFIADAHLGQGSESSNRARERDLLAFLDRVGGEGAALYVVGDLFDFWFEYGHAIPKRFVRVLTALAALARAASLSRISAEITISGSVIIFAASWTWLLRTNPSRSRFRTGGSSWRTATDWGRATTDTSC